MEKLVEKIIPYTLLKNTYTNFKQTEHSHYTVEIIYNIKGALQFRFPDDNGEAAVVLASNQFIIIMPNQRHSYDIYGSADILVFELGYKKKDITIDKWIAQGECADKLAFLKPIASSGQTYMLFDDQSNTYPTLERLLVLIHNQQQGINNDLFDLEYEVLLLQLAIKISRCNQLLVPKLPSNRHVYNALMYIAENYMKNISVDQIAAFTKVSSSYIQRLFKQTYGQSVHSLLTRQRMLAASELLKNSTLNLSKISARVGYSNTRTFQSAFKIFYGMSCSEYRKENRSNRFIFYRDYINPDRTMNVLPPKKLAKEH